MVSLDKMKLKFEIKRKVQDILTKVLADNILRILAKSMQLHHFPHRLALCWQPVACHVTRLSIN